MILLTSSGAVGGMHAKLANGQNQHNCLAKAEASARNKTPQK